MNDTQQNATSVLCWPKRLLSADDLRRHLTSQREVLLLPKTIVTPLAADELKAKGVRILWQAPKPPEAMNVKQPTWIYAQEKSDAMILSAVQALDRDGIVLTRIEGATARTIAEAIRTQINRGGIVFTNDAATVCCIANKVAGIRAVAVLSNAQVQGAQKDLGANLFAIEMPGRTFFEIRQMLRTIVAVEPNCCEKIAATLRELDGHAHR